MQNSAVLTQFVIECRQRHVSDDMIRQSLQAKGWPSGTIEQAMEGAGVKKEEQASTQQLVSEPKPLSANLTQFVRECRQRHVSDEMISQSLRSKGWPSNAIEQALSSVSNEELPATKVTTNHQTKLRLHLNPPLAIVCVIGLVIILSSAWLLLHRPQSTAAGGQLRNAKALQVHDANFSIDLPPGWKADDTNANGSGISSYYYGNNAARMTIFVLPRQGNQTGATHIDETIRGLTQNGAKLTELPLPLALQKSKMTAKVAAISQTDNPNVKRYYVFAGLLQNNTLYNIDMSTDAGTWSTVKDGVFKAIAGFRPNIPTASQNK